MDPKLLEPDELAIECELRNIQGLQSVKQSMLTTYFEYELIGKEDKPTRAHEAALKNPRLEVAKCEAKLAEIQNSIKESLENKVDCKELLLKVMKTRALHYRFRLERIASLMRVHVQ